MFVASDDAHAKQTVMQLAQEIGFVAIPVPGGLGCAYGRLRQRQRQR